MDTAPYKNCFNNHARYLLGMVLLLLTAGICASFSLTDTDGYELARQQILLRKIGHEVLLHSGDSISRVLPVQNVAKNEYQIRFENELTFQPDTLERIISRTLAKNTLSRNYVVGVLSCDTKSVVFGYAVAKNKNDNVMACSGRVQPKSCYLIDIKFENAGIPAMQKGYLVGGLPLLAFVGLLLLRTVKTRKKQTIQASDQSLMIGNTIFDTQKRMLLFPNAAIDLTAKESKLLLIFAQSPNMVIERSRLQKEIWEDEGVIVGRSLDMFISKLRKNWKTIHRHKSLTSIVKATNWKLKIN